ncbi:MAG: hypothetical protein OXN89_18880 [Bryobacterales bacterium]|nr:hypothetical protein [Bryobacterales bacterium]
MTDDPKVATRANKARHNGLDLLGQQDFSAVAYLKVMNEIRQCGLEINHYASRQASWNVYQMLNARYNAVALIETIRANR